MLFDKSRLNEEKAKHGMTAVRAMELALDTSAILFFHLPESFIRFVR